MTLAPFRAAANAAATPAGPPPQTATSTSAHTGICRDSSVSVRATFLLLVEGVPGIASVISATPQPTVSSGSRHSMTLPDDDDCGGPVVLLPQQKNPTANPGGRCSAAEAGAAEFRTGGCEGSVRRVPGFLRGFSLVSPPRGRWYPQGQNEGIPWIGFRSGKSGMWSAELGSQVARRGRF